MLGVAVCDSYTPIAMVPVSVVTELGCRSGPSLARLKSSVRGGASGRRAGVLLKGTATPLVRRSR